VSSPQAGRLSALRSELDKDGLDGFVVPLTDEHASEYVAAYAQRLAWLTGFTGSAGTGVVLAETAAIFVDGRYSLQVENEVDASLFERRNLAEKGPLDWLAETAPRGARIGYDPRLHAPAWVERAEEALARIGAAAVAVEDNPIDRIWQDQPERPRAPVRPHPAAYAGLESREKRWQIAETLRESGARAAVLTALDSIAWLFNIRGGDVVHTPVTLAYAVIYDDASARLFVDADKLDAAVRAHLGADVRLESYARFYAALEELAGDGWDVLADPASANAAVFARLEAGGARIVKAQDPCALPKARKNATEIAGARAAHIRDGAAVTEFLCWIDRHAPDGEIDEFTAAQRLEAFRRQRESFIEPSFDTISGAGPNGAIVHYRVSPETSRRLERGMLYLVDSGGQYPDGTTDITRTMPIGAVGEEERERFTRVLKGHIAIATLRFPKGTTGTQIDAMARYTLWQAGLDYDHGTGHGVGAHLGVHEGPQRIAKPANGTALEPGMICSNEPGYYKAGAYGIRIENLVLVVADEKPGDEREMLGFETLALAPIDRRLVRSDMLTLGERAWLDGYHARVRERLDGEVAPETRAWLETMTAPLEESGQ